MSGGVYFLSGDDELVEMREQPYETEDILQALLAKFPALLVGDDGSDGSGHLLLIAREAALPDDADAAGRWSIDHLFLDKDAIPTLVEVKRSSDTRIRREVVGQILDYAANAVAWWPIDEIRQLFLTRCAAEHLDPDEQLAGLLGEQADPEEFWQRAGANLTAGRLRLVFVSDEIPRELRRVIEFLNDQMRADVLGIEVKQYLGDGGLRTLVPRAVGQTASSQARKRITSPSRKWDEQSFFEVVTERRGVDEAKVARVLYDWSLTNATKVTFGRGKEDGSFAPVITAHGLVHYPFVVYSYGRVEIQFQHLTRTPFDDPQVREEFRAQLNRAQGIEIPPDALRRRPSIPLSQLAASPDGLSGLVRALDWFIARASNPPAVS